MKRILIDYNGEAVRTACLDDGRLMELFIDNKSHGSQVGHIINGVVRNILPGRFAFIDIGQEKNAFMNIPPGVHLKQGQYAAVQVKKDASGSKGANVSQQLYFNGRLTIIYPSAEREIGISQKIKSNTERKRLQRIAKDILPEGCGVIFRTQSENKNELEIRAEFERLTELCAKTLETARYSSAPCLLYKDNSLYDDLFSEDIDEIIVNCQEGLEEVKKAAWARIPLLFERVRYYAEDSVRMFDAFGVEKQIARALSRDVWLPCGGFITFDECEACVVVDVNTGKFTGKNNHREMALKVNLEAAACAAWQITLRNLSGMIIVDFIDMAEPSDKQQLIAAFSQSLSTGRIPAKIVGMTELGLVQITRQKKREPLSRLLAQTCPYCHGTGHMRIT